MSRKKIPKYELVTLEDIQNIPDLETALGYMRKWKISIKGVSRKEKAIERLTEFWRARELASVFEEEDESDKKDIRNIKDDVEETTTALHEVLIKVRDRNGKLPLLEEKARHVHRMSKQFKKISYKARVKRCCRQNKCCIATIVIIVSLLLIAAIIIFLLYEKGYIKF